jgi:tetratricopeptide (TPR) repeat protein
VKVKFSTALALREAEIYYAQGLLNEPLQLYETILAETPSLDPQTRKKITEKIAKLKQAIALDEDEEPPPPSAKEIDTLYQSWTGAQEPSEALICALAFKEMQLFRESISEYLNSLTVHKPKTEIIEDLADCLEGLESDQQSVDIFSQMLEEAKIPNNQRPYLLAGLGKTFARRGNDQLALYLYREARQTGAASDALDRQIAKLQDRLIAAHDDGQSKADPIRSSGPDTNEVQISPPQSRRNQPSAKPFARVVSWFRRLWQGRTQSTD